MNEWEAKYKALVVGIEDKTLIDNAEKLVDVAIKASCTSGYSFDRILYALLDTMGLLRNQPPLPIPNAKLTFLEALKFLVVGKCVAIRDKYGRFYRCNNQGNLAVWKIWPDSRSTYHIDFLRLIPSIFLGEWSLVMSVTEFD
jgi:hypothetical protein